MSNYYYIMYTSCLMADIQRVERQPLYFRRRKLISVFSFSQFPQNPFLRGEKMAFEERKKKKIPVPLQI